MDYRLGTVKVKLIGISSFRPIYVSSLAYSLFSLFFCFFRKGEKKRNSSFFLLTAIILFHRLFHLSYFRFHIEVIIWYLSVSFWLTSLLWSSLVASRLLQMVLFHSFLWLSNVIYLDHIFFIRSSLDGHLGCFLVLAIVNNTAVNDGMHASFWTIVFSRYMPRSRSARSYVSSIFSFLRKFDNVLHSSYINLHSHQQYKSSLFLHILSRIKCL